MTTTTNTTNNLSAVIEEVDNHNNKSRKIIDIAKLHDISNLFYSENYLIKIIKKDDKCLSEIWELKENPLEAHKLFKTKNKVIGYGLKEEMEKLLTELTNTDPKDAKQSFNNRASEENTLNQNHETTPSYQPTHL